MNFGNGLPTSTAQSQGSNSFIARLIPSKFEVALDNTSLITLAAIVFGAVVASKLT